MIALVAACGGTTPSTAPATNGPTAAVTPKPVPTPTAMQSVAAYVCAEETTGCAGPLDAGDHKTVAFDHPFTFTVPAGWTNILDRPRAYNLEAPGAPTAEFRVWSQAAPEAQTADCEAAREPGYGTSVSEWLRFLKETKRVKILGTETFDLGQHKATRLDLAPDPAFKEMCPFNTDPFSLLVTDTGNPPTRRHGGTPASMTLIDFGDDTLIVWNDGGETGLEAMLELSLPVIKTIRFDP